MTISENQKKIKVIFLTKWYPNDTNIQLAVFIQKHAAAVSKYCDVALLSIVSNSEQAEKYRISYVDNAGFPAVIVYYKKANSGLPGVGKIVSFFRYLSAYKKGVKLVKQKIGDHDITHAYILLRPAIFAWWIKLISRKPFVISEQWSGYVTGKFQEGNFLKKNLTRFVADRASAITVVSKFLKEGMIKNGIKGNYFVIPNVIEVNSIPETEIKNDGMIRILTVADLVDDIKNISGTIKAFSKVVIQNANLRLDIVGGGLDQKKLENISAELSLLNKNIFFHGMKTNAEVYQFLHQCDFLIMNSRFETFSSICAEAMSCGKPVIATRCGGPDEFVLPFTGLLIEPDNETELADAIKNMIANYAKYDSQQIKKYAADLFNSTAIGKQFFDIYKNILS